MSSYSTKKEVSVVFDPNSCSTCPLFLPCCVTVIQLFVLCVRLSVCFCYLNAHVCVCTWTFSFCSRSSLTLIKPFYSVKWPCSRSKFPSENNLHTPQTLTSVQPGKIMQELLRSALISSSNWFLGLGLLNYWMCFEWNKRRCTYVHLKNLF